MKSEIKYDKTKLEIWDRAQHENAQRRKSDWKDKLRG